ncbi:MAG TPA: helix-hairpin-helix domain-containing protein [Ignavibacteria bacterium]|nr:helix-hairpin-helix domain-containing protein [Ignavibacteria bacterium]HMR38913.1 helix-hairpin-helix domain-containing protein [Ignavibacteria bacterium]
MSELKGAGQTMNRLMKNISFTKNETRVILFVITVLVTGFSIKFYKQVLNSPSVRFDYTSEDSVFKSLSVNKVNQDKSVSNDSVKTGIESNENADIRSEGLLNINTATRSDLIDLPGIGESIADKIISYRERNKKFKRAEDLMNISGIGKKKFDKLKSQIKAE